MKDVAHFFKHGSVKKKIPPYAIALWDLYHSFPSISIIQMLKNYDNYLFQHQ
jgi:hypothetical protein